MNRLTPAQLRRKGFSLMRQCWLPLLLAALLTTLLSSCGDLAKQYGRTMPDRIEQAVFAEFEAENPRPAAPAALEDWEMERIAHAYFICTDIKGEQAERLWSLAGSCISLAAGLFSAIIMVGVYGGLLARLRGSEEPVRLFSGFRRWKAAIWLKLRVTVCMLGWGLLPLLPAAMMSACWGSVGQLLEYFLLMAVVLWARMYYALPLLHLADAPALSTTECLVHGKARMRFFTVGGLFRVVWPLLLVILADIALDAAAAWLPALSLPSGIFSFAAEVLLSMTGWAILACVYEEIRRTGMSASAKQAQEESAS